MQIAQIGFAASFACLVAIAAQDAHAQAYPNRPIRIIEPFPAGGGGDVLLRVLAPKLTAVLGQSIVVDNRPGAGGNIGAELAAKAPPDGYTLFNGVTVVLAPSRSMYSKLPYDVLKDFTPITRLGAGAYALVVHPSLPVRSVKDLVALAKARPGQVNYASAGGVGSGSHLCAELFKQRAGINLVHVAYKGGPPAVAAVVAGETETNFATLTSVLAQVKAGRLRALGVTGTNRSALFPEVPTIAESGYTGFEVTPVFGVYAPTGTPREIVTLLNTELRKILAMEDVRERFASQGVVSGSSTPEELGALMAAEVAHWAKLIKAANIKLD